jgi:transcription elongation factor Elf1
MFSRKDNLREHLRAHAGQVKRKKKYNCQHCNKEFYGTTLLQIHMRTHTGKLVVLCVSDADFFPQNNEGSSLIRRGKAIPV